MALAPARPARGGAVPLPVRLLVALVCVIGPCAAKKPKKQKYRLHIPRVTPEELSKNETLRTGLHGFVLTRGIRQWKALNWTMDYLKKKIPFEWVDYYPDNMKDQGNKPYLLKFDEAVMRYGERSPKPKYLQLRLGLRGWKRLRKDFEPMVLPDIFWDDASWIKECMKKDDGKVDSTAIDNFFTTQQWKFLLIGEKGTAMFFHKDGTAAASWQAQILGRKTWVLCPNDQSQFLNENIDLQNPDYKKFPNFAKAHCGQIDIHPGELIYYPAYWWHQGMQHDTPTLAYTGALVGTEAERTDLGGAGQPHVQFYNDLVRKCGTCWQKGNPKRLCDDISVKWPGAAPPMLRVLCDSYLPKCLKLWGDHAQTLHARDKLGGGDEL